jgi:hypothetical protein
VLAAMLRSGEFVGSGAGGHLLGRGVDEGHGGFGEVAVFGGLPLVVLVDEDRADEVGNARASSSRVIASSSPSVIPWRNHRESRDDPPNRWTLRPSLPPLHGTEPAPRLFLFEECVPSGLITGKRHGRVRIV